MDFLISSFFALHKIYELIFNLINLLKKFRFFFLLIIIVIGSSLFDSLIISIIRILSITKSYKLVINRLIFIFDDLKKSKPAFDFLKDITLKLKDFNILTILFLFLYYFQYREL